MDVTYMNESFNKMPVLFIGHGSPMNAIEDNSYTEEWSEIAKKLPRPKAILSISAHWYTSGSRINDETSPKMIYDMFGFPKELYNLKYPVSGAPELAHLTKELLGTEIVIDNTWGIDHGTWSVLCKMFPEADIPVFQLSIDRYASAEEHYKLGKKLNSLREKGVLILGSGNVVHNLALVDFDMEAGFPWAEEFDSFIKEKIEQRKYNDVIHYEKAGQVSKIAFHSPDHYYPLLYVLGASEEQDKLNIYNASCVFGSLSMTCYLFGL